MQKAKDSFLNHLVTRLAQMDSARTVTVDLVTRPAIIAAENERPELADSFENCYCIGWKEIAARADSRGQQSVACEISYWTLGSPEMSGVDRGRRLTEMDELLRSMLACRTTAKLDLTTTPATEMGSNVFWGEPKYMAAEQLGMKLKRKVILDVHFFSEEIQ